MDKTIKIKLEAPLMDRLEIYAEALGIPVNLVIQNLLINQWAKEAAEHELEVPTTFLQFMRTGDGDTITGEALFYALKSIYKQEIERAGKPGLSEGEIKAQDKIMKDYLQGLPPDKRAEVEQNIEKQKKWLEEHNEPNK